MKKKSMHLLFFVQLLAGFVLSAQTDHSPFITKTYTSQDGLPHSYVYQILQDRNGYLWINTRYGLSRFDGLTFSNFSHNDEIRGVPLGGLIEDKNGLICLLSGDELFYLENGSKVSLTKSGSYFPVYQLMANGKTTDNGYWTCTKEGIFPLHGATPKKIHLPQDADIKICRKIFETDSGCFFSFLNEFVFVSNQGKLTDIGKLLPASRFMVIMGYWNKEFYIYTDKGVYAQSPGGIRTLFKDQLRGKRLYAAYQDKKDRIWIGTREDGVLVSKPGQEEELGYSIPISNHLISGFYEDKEDNMWIAGFEGLVKVKEKKYESFPESEFPFLSDLNCIAKDEKGTIYIFSETHGFSRWKSGQFIYQADNVLKGHLVDELILDFKNRLWCITRRNDLILLEQDKINYVNYPLSLAGDLRQVIIFDPFRLKTWLAGEDLLMGDENGFSIFADLQSTTIHNPLKIGYPGQGKIIVATGENKLLSINSSNTIEPIQTPHDFHPQKIYRMFFDSQDNIWFSYPGIGLMQCEISQDNTLKIINTFNRENGFTNDFIQSLECDQQGRIWISTMGGLALLDFSFRPPNHAAVYLLGRDEGIQASGMEYGRLLCDNSGDMWYSTQYALMKFDVNKMQFKNQPPHATIENVLLHNQETNWAHYSDSLAGVFRIPFNPVLNHRENSLTIVFKAATMIDAEYIQYSYLLSGLDNYWSHQSKNNTITFTNLHPGNYTFFVRACSNNLFWSTPALFSFSIRKPYWQTWWFMTVLLFFISGLIYQVYLLRIRHLNRDKMIRDQIASDLHDDLGSTLNSVKVYANVAMLENNNKQYLEKIDENIQEAITSVRDIIWVLDEKKDTIDHLVTRIAQFESPLCHANHITFIQQVDSSVYPVMLGREEKRNLYMILKEAVNNSIKYAACKTITFAVSKDNNRLIFQISDDGIGISEGTISEGHGLHNMRRRAAEIHYKIKIISKEGMGTNIRLEKG